MNSTAQKTEKVILIDGNGLAYRAFYALPPLKTSQGEPVNAVYGFTNMLFKILKRERPDYVGVAFDKSRPTKRLEEFDKYKAHRQKMPEELQRQMPIMEEVAEVFNIPVFHVEGYEADDCIATLTSESEKKGFSVKIYSGDLDMLQLVSDLTRVVTTRRGISDLVIYDRDMVRKRYSINPSQLVDYKALAGDSSDHIPGIPGIGEASASKLLNQFDSIEEMYEESAKIPSRWRKQILENQERAFLSKHLASLHKELDLGLDWEKMKHTPFNREALKKLFIRLEFKSMLKKLGFKDEELEEIQEIVVQIVGKDEDLDTMLSSLKSAGAFSLVWIDNEDGDLVGLAIAQGSNNGYYFPFILPEQLNIASTFGISIFSRDRIIHELKPLMDNKDVKKFVYDLKDGIRFLKRSEYFTGNGFYDLDVNTFMVEPENPPRSLETILSRYTDFIPKTLNEITTHQKGRKKVKVMEIPLQDLTLFLAGRAVRLNNLGPEMDTLLKEKGQLEFYKEVEAPLTILLAAIETRGINLDVTAAKEESEKLQHELDNISALVYKDVGHEFNINSTRQLGRILFEELKLSGAKKTATGFRTDADLLGKLSGEHPVINKILKFREVSRIKSSFVDSLLQQANNESGKLKLKFNQNGSSMGKLTTSSPNLASLPKHLRRVFIPSDEDRTFLEFDYPSLQLQLLLAQSQEYELLERFAQGEDIIRLIAERMFVTKPDQVSPEQEGIAREVTYGLINGASSQALSQKLNIKRKQAKEYQEILLEKIPGIRQFSDRVIEECRKNGYVKSLIGRRRDLPTINSQNKGQRTSAEKSALQFAVLGSTNDVIKKTMVECLEKILRGHRDIHLLIQTGTSFLFETRKRRAEKYSGQIKEIMLSVAGMEKPLVVKIREGNNWLDMNLKELK